MNTSIASIMRLIGVSAPIGPLQGEASYYAQILSQHPEQQTLIQPLHEAACQRGSEAKGALDAVINLRKKLGEEAAS